MTISRFAHTGKKIIGIGRNFAAHIKELNNPMPDEIFFFLKPTSSYVLNDGPVEIPRGLVVNHEVELGVIIDKDGRDVSQKDAMGIVAGYCLAIDYTGRNLQDLVKSKGLPWSAVKGFDTFCPVGDFIPKDQIKDPHNVDLWLKINDTIKQSDSTSLMLNRIPSLIEHCSSIMSLQPGDLLLTGTPKGVGPVNPGDKITAGLEYEGKVLSRIQHEVLARKGGYLFNPKK